MIRQIEIKNFQSHRHTIINLADGLNIIKGSSHEGKSGIVRALKWALQNKPRGDGFRSWFAEDKESVSVSITFSNGDQIIRERGKENIYRTIVNQEELVYKAVRSDVPDEVKEVMQMNELNLQSQGDGYFMLGESPSARAKKLNKIVGMGIIDEVTKKINSHISVTNTKLIGIKEDIKETEEKLNTFTDIENLDSLIGKVEEIKTKSTRIAIKRQSLEDIINTIESKQNDIDGLTDWLEIENHTIFIEAILRMISDLKKRKEILMSMIKDISNHKNVIKRTNTLLDASPQLEEIEKIHNELNRNKHRVFSLSKLYTTIDNKENIIKTTSDIIKRTQEKLNKIDICPTCGQKVEEWN